MKRERLKWPFRSILCPVDFSAHSAAALRHAAILARAGKGTLTALFVVDPLLSAAVATAHDEHALERTSRQELRRFVARALTPRSAKSVRLVTVVGRPAREILAFAKSSRTALIVLGTHGLSGVQKVFFGSTTDQVLRRSRTPVLAVPARVSAPRQGWPRRLIVAAIELDGRAVHEMTEVASFADGFRARLLVVHAIPDIRTPPWLNADICAYAATRLSKATQQLDDLCGALGGNVTAECRVLTGDPAERIAALAGKERADILILPLRRPAGLLRGKKRGTAYRILCSARTPILAWPSSA